MKRLQANFKSLKNHLSPSFDILTLNKSGSRYNPFGGDHGFGGYSKGVENDFLLIFSVKEKHSSNVQGSIAFVVDYINKKSPTYTVQIKLSESNDSITSSLLMDHATFRPKLNYLNRLLSEMSNKQQAANDAVSYFDMINQIFECSDQNLAIDIKNGERECKEALKQVDRDVEITESEYQNQKETLDAALRCVNKIISRTKEQEIIFDLEKQLKSLKKIVASKRESYEVKNDVSSHRAALVNKMRASKNAVTLRREKIEKLRENYPSIIFDKVMRNLEV